MARNVVPGPSADGPYTSSGQTILQIARNEASERGQDSVRPMHLLLAAARLENRISGYVFEQVGVTPKKLEPFLTGKGEARRMEARPGLGFHPDAKAVLDLAVDMAIRWNHRCLSAEQFTGALAETTDPEVQAALTYCGTSGAHVMRTLESRMIEVGLLKGS